MFNLGGRAFTRRISQQLGVSLAEAEARKVRHTERLLPPDQDAQVGKLLRADVEVLLQGLNLCLAELARSERLPSSIYLCGGGSLVPELAEEVARGPWASGLPFSRPPRVRLLEPSDVGRVVDASGQLTTAQDVGPMGLAHHAVRMDADDRDPVNALMRGVLKAMKV